MVFDWALYQKQTEKPAPGTAPVPIIEARSNPLPADILNDWVVPEVAAILLLFRYTAPAPGNGSPPIAIS
jgi:hypothetical protein